MNDMFQTDIWSFFNQYENNLAGTKDIKVEKKEVTKKTKSKTAKKAANVADTVKCCGRGFIITLTGMKNVDTCVKELVERGYKEILLSSKVNLSEDGSILTFETPSKASADSQQVTLPVVILDGELRMELSTENFVGLDEDEISISDLIEKWIEVNPSYAGCGMYYSSEYGVATPVFDPVLNNISLPASVSVYGESTLLSETEFLKSSVPGKEIIGTLNLLDTEAVLCKGNDNYFVSFQSKKGISFDKSTYSNGTKEVNSVVEKYALPFTIHLANFGIDIQVSENDFPQKHKVTQEEILHFLTPNYKMFGANDRKADFIYLKDKNILSIASISGRKG